MQNAVQKERFVWQIAMEIAKVARQRIVDNSLNRDFTDREYSA